jgi:hypothetical protein
VSDTYVQSIELLLQRRPRRTVRAVERCEEQLRRKSRKNYYGKEKESSKEEESCKEAPLNLSGHPLERKNTDSSVFFL